MSQSFEALERVASADDPTEIEQHLEDARSAFIEAQRSALLAAQGRRASPRGNLPSPEPVDMPTLVSRNLGYWRRLSGWSQARLAGAMTRLGYSWSRVTVAEVENATRKVSLDELMGLASLYATPLLVLLSFGPDDSYALPDGRVLESPYANQVVAGRRWTPVWDQQLSGPARAAVASGDETDWRPAKDVADRLFRAPGWQERHDDLQRTLLGLKAEAPAWLGLEKSPEDQ